MEKFLKALGKVLVCTLYVIVVIVLIGVVRWIFRAITQQSD